MLQCTSLLRTAVVTAMLALAGPAGVLAQTTQAPADTSAPRVQSALGKTVRVTQVDGTKQKGRLVSFDPAGVVLARDGQEHALGLADVRRVERVAHGVQWGVIAGTVAGFVYGYGITEEDGEGSSREMAGGAIVAALGAAGGAGVGALINRVRRNSNRIYERPAGTLTIAVVPVVGPRGHVGFASAIRW